MGWYRLPQIIHLPPSTRSSSRSWKYRSELGPVRARKQVHDHQSPAPGRGDSSNMILPVWDDTPWSIITDQNIRFKTMHTMSQMSYTHKKWSVITNEHQNTKSILLSYALDYVWSIISDIAVSRSSINFYFDMKWPGVICFMNKSNYDSLNQNTIFLKYNSISKMRKMILKISKSANDTSYDWSNYTESEFVKGR